MREEVEAVLKATGVDAFLNAMDSAGRAVENVGSRTEAMGAKSQGVTGKIGGFLSTVGKIAGLVGITKLVSGGFDLVKSSVGGAIDRLDTMNQFPRMMQTLGYSTDDSQKAIGRLSDGIQGLPTRLDEVTSTAQLLALMTGDLDGAVDTTLALNNAFLASGSDSAEAARGMQQYKQMLATGTVDLRSFRTLMETMPVALMDVAESFGFTGASAKNDLFEALKEGDITFDQFNQRLVEIDQQVGGFADRALEGSKGIRTSMTNIRTAVVVGLANAIDRVDQAMQGAGFGSIVDNLERVKVGVQNGFRVIGDWVEKGIDVIFRFIEVLRDSTAFQTFIELLGKARDWFMRLVEALLQSEAFARIKDLLRDIGQALLEVDFLKLANDVMTTVQKWAPLIAGIVGAIAAFKLLSTGLAAYLAVKKAVMIIMDIWKAKALVFGAVTMGMNLPLIAVAAAIGALIAIGILLWRNWDTITEKARELHERVKTAVQNMVDSVVQFFVRMWEGARERFNAFHDGAVEIAGRLRERIVEIFNAIRERVGEAIEKMREVIQNAFERIREIASTIMEGVKVAIERVWNGIKEVTSIAWEVIKNVIFVAIGIVALFIQRVFNDIKTVITTIWNGIKTVASTIWGAIGDTVMTIVYAIRDYIIDVFNKIQFAATTVWNGIKNTITTVVNAIRTVITTVWNAIRTAITTVLNAIKTVVTNVWNAIRDDVMRVVNAIRTVITNVWNAIRTYITNVLNNIKTAATTVWNGIRTVITTIVNAIRNVITTVWNAIRTVITTVLNAIRTTASTVWSAIRNVITTAVNAIRDVITTVWNAIRNTITTVMNAIRDTATNVWNAIRNTVSTVSNAIRNTVSSIFNSLRNIVSSAFSAVRNAVTNGMQSAWNAVKAYFTRFRDAGRNIVTNIASGITGAVGKVTDAIGGVVKKVRDFLPFSPAKEGPLEDIHRLDFGGPVSSSIERSERQINRAMEKVLEVPEFDETRFGRSLKGAQSKFESRITYSNDEVMNRRPAEFRFRFGKNEYKRYVRDISHQQGDEEDLNLAF